MLQLNPKQHAVEIKNSEFVLHNIISISSFRKVSLEKITSIAGNLFNPIFLPSLPLLNLGRKAASLGGSGRRTPIGSNLGINLGKEQSYDALKILISVSGSEAY